MSASPAACSPPAEVSGTRSLLLAASFPPALGGVETLLYQTTRRLATPPLVLAPAPAFAPDLSVSAVRLGLAHRLAYRPLWRLHPSLHYTLSFLLPAFRAAATWRPEVIQAGHIYLAPVAWLLSRRLGVPFIIYTYGQEVWHPAKPAAAGHQVWRLGTQMTVGQEVWRPGTHETVGQEVWRSGTHETVDQEVWRPGAPATAGEDMPRGGPPTAIHAADASLRQPWAIDQEAPPGGPPTATHATDASRRQRLAAAQETPEGGHPSGAGQETPRTGHPSGAGQETPRAGHPSGAGQKVRRAGHPWAAAQEVPQGGHPSGARQDVPWGGQPMGIAALDACLRGGALRAADRVLVPGTFTASLLADWQVAPARITAIPYGADPQLEAPPPPGAGCTLLTVARLVPRKGIDTVIRALPSLPADVSYRVVGRGPDEPRLRALAASEGVAQRVQFLGRLDDEALADEYRRCTIFVLPARRTEDGSLEGYGLVYFEAAAWGRPVIAGRSGGEIDAVVDGQTGLLVNGDSVTEVASAIASLLQDPQRLQALGAAGRARVERSHNWTNSAATIDAVLAEVASRAPSSTWPR